MATGNTMACVKLHEADIQDSKWSRLLPLSSPFVIYLFINSLFLPGKGVMGVGIISGAV